MTIAGTRHKTIDTINTVSISESSIIHWMLDTMLMATTDSRITQIGTLSVFLEEGRWLSLERIAKNKWFTCFTYMLWQIKMYRSNEIAIAVYALQLKATCTVMIFLDTFQIYVPYDQKI